MSKRGGGYSLPGTWGLRGEGVGSHPPDMRYRGVYNLPLTWGTTELGGQAGGINPVGMLSC